MKSRYRGVGMLGVVTFLAFMALVLGFVFYKKSALDNERRVAYAGAEKAAMEVAPGDWVKVAKAMSSCHSELGPYGISKIVGMNNDDLPLCPEIVDALRAQRVEGAEMLAKRAELKQAYEGGFWRSVSPAVYAEAKGESPVALIYN